MKRRLAIFLNYRFKNYFMMGNQISKLTPHILSFFRSYPRLDSYRHSVLTGSFRGYTSLIRLLPDFIIIGAQKCGTTSFYDYLIKHPAIHVARQKEIHFFEADFQSGLIFYKRNFPTKIEKYFVKNIERKKFITGEATPEYLHHPLVPKRLVKTIPNIRLIILLRNPVDRAYSHYNFNVRKGWEKTSFEEAIQLEESRLNGEVDNIFKNESYSAKNFKHYSYLGRGRYFEQINYWQTYFPKKQFFFIQTEDLEKNPQKILKKTFNFLELDHFEIDEMQRLNVGNYKKMAHETRLKLIEYFKPHNEKLYNFLGKKFEWDI